MSVAFRRESDEEHLEPKFELPIPPGPNYVTPTGLAQIEARVAELEAAIAAGGTEDALKALKRDLRYWHQRHSSVIPAPSPAPGVVGIGTTVKLYLARSYAGDVMLAASYAITRGMTVDDVADTWAPYLTMSEALRIAAGLFRSDKPTSCCA